MAFEASVETHKVAVSTYLTRFLDVKRLAGTNRDGHHVVADFHKGGSKPRPRPVGHLLCGLLNNQTMVSFATGDFGVRVDWIEKAKKKMPLVHGPETDDYTGLQE